MTNKITKEIQDKELEILLYFKKICDKYGLKFYLCGGGLIGAVRHKGFIPWDDDLDVFMPRPDYEKLAEIWRKHADTKHYSYCRTDLNHNYHDGGASIRDNYTTFINKHSVDEDICHGLALEIMPIDGCPKSHFARLFQLYNAMLFSLFNVQRLPNNKGKIFRFMAGIIYKIIPSKVTRYKIWKKAERRMMKYNFYESDEVTELIGSIRGMKIRHPRKDFEDITYLTFEGRKVPVMSGYDRYLHLIWGDYMQLPPADKRVAKHDAVYIDMDNTYKKYRGKYYCIDK